MFTHQLATLHECSMCRSSKMFPQAYRPLMLDEDVNILLRKMNLNDCLYTTEIPISFENYKKNTISFNSLLGGYHK